MTGQWPALQTHAAQGRLALRAGTRGAHSRRTGAGRRNPTLAFKTIEDSQGKLIDTFMRVPVIRCDAINSTEAGI